MNSDMINKSAVSPVLAVTLLIAVTIALSAVIGVFALDITESRSVTDINDKDIGASLSEENGEVTVDIKTGTADAMKFIVNGDEKKLFREVSPGDSFSVYGIDADSDITLIEIDGDSEHIIRTLNTVQDNEAQSTILFDKNLYFETEALRIEVDDPNLSTDRDYFISIFSETEGQTVVFENVPAGVSTYTTKVPVGEKFNSTRISETDAEFDYTPDVGNEDEVINRTKYNDNNTVTFFFDEPANSEGEVVIFSSETVTLSHAGGSTFTGTIDISQTDALGTLNVSDGDTITVRYKDANTGEIREDTTTFTP